MTKIYESVFGQNPKLLLNFENTPDIMVLGTFEDYYVILNKRPQYLHKLIQDFKSKRLAMIYKDRNFFQHNIADLVYLISLITSQLHTASRKVTIKYVGPLVIYKIIDLHNYLLMMLDCNVLRGLFEHERLKLTIIRTSQRNTCNLVQLKQIINIEMKI